MNALLYSANTTAQAITSGQTFSFGSTVRKLGNNITVSGGNVTVNGEGYYSIVANVSFEADASGSLTIQLYENGTAIPGARASITTTADTYYDVAIPAAIKIKCCEEKIISATLSGGDATIANATILITR